MKNIGILTFHCSDNYGAMLQAYAMKTFLINNGQNARIIRYEPLSLTGKHFLFPYIKQKTPIHTAYWSFRGFLKNLKKGSNFKIQHDNMNKFRKKYLIKDEKKISPAQINSLGLDILILGSDQIWNPDITYGLDDMYFGANFKGKKISYAASIGGSKLNSSYDTKMKKLITNLDSISVRESKVIDYIKALGFKYSTLAGITFSMDDVKVPEAKKDLLKEADEKVENVRKQYVRGLITDDERYNAVINIWEETTNKVSNAMEDNFEELNPIYMMVKSGARGNMNQLRQIAGMRGLMASTTGKAVEIPIKSSFAEGLDALEYFISAHGARKGLSDTALRTADSGYLTRRLVDVSQDIIVREYDCETEEGIMVYDIKDGNQIIEKMQERLIGRYPLEDVYNPKTKELIVDKDTMITEKIADEIVEAGIEKLKVRSVLGCHSKRGVCQKCYGMGLARRDLVSIGESVGIIAAQSIGEPGTQLTMRTIHSGGVAGVADITQGLPRVEELFEARKPKGVAIISEIAGKVKIKETKKKKEVVVTSKDNSNMVEAGDPFIEGSLNPSEILEIKGPEGVYEYLISEVQKVYRNQGVDINDKHIEVIGRQMLKKVRVEDNGDTDMFPGELIDMYEFADKNKETKEQGKRPATGKRVLLGITKASLATDSFLSAASFQETTRVLTEAAVKGKIDDLVGLKENVIIGKLIPAGTGMKKYQNIHINTEKELEETSDTEATV